MFIKLNLFDADNEGTDETVEVEIKVYSMGIMAVE